MVVQVLYGDALVLLKAIKSQSINLVIADPPYALQNPDVIGLKQDGYGTGIPDLKTWLWEAKRTVAMDGFIAVWEHPLHLDMVFEVGRSLGLTYRDTVVWDATNRYNYFKTGGFYSRWDACVVWSKGRKSMDNNGAMTLDLVRAPVVTEGPVPGAKPLSVMKTLVSMMTKWNDWVLDPFCGSGTTARACLELGRNCVTMEIRRELKPYIDRRLLAKIAHLDQLV